MLLYFSACQLLYIWYKYLIIFVHIETRAHAHVCTQLHIDDKSGPTSLLTHRSYVPFALSLRYVHWLTYLLWNPFIFQLWGVLCEFIYSLHVSLPHYIQHRVMKGRVIRGSLLGIHTIYVFPHLESRGVLFDIRSKLQHIIICLWSFTDWDHLKQFRVLATLHGYCLTPTAVEVRALMINYI